MKKESFYFSHDANAHYDDKILELRSVYKWEGYGVYWAIIEILRAQTDYTYSLSKISGLSIAIGMPKDWLQSFIDYCVQICLFVENNGEIYSESLMKRMELIDEKRRKRAEAGRLGGIAKAKINQNSSNAKANSSKKRKEKENKEKKKKINENIYTVDFEHFWTVWKSSIKNDSNKKKSFDSFKKLSDTDKKDLFDSVQDYSKSNKDHQYLKRCETYINQRHWEQRDTFKPVFRALGDF